jgi:hypothetical protein
MGRDPSSVVTCPRRFGDARLADRGFHGGKLCAQGTVVYRIVERGGN